MTEQMLLSCAELDQPQEGHSNLLHTVRVEIAHLEQAVVAHLEWMQVEKHGQWHDVDDLIDVVKLSTEESAEDAWEKIVRETSLAADEVHADLNDHISQHGEDAEIPAYIKQAQACVKAHQDAENLLIKLTNAWKSLRQMEVSDALTLALYPHNEDCNR